MRLIDFFDQGAARYPERACLSDGAQALSYATVSDYTHRIALALGAAGLGRESRVAVLSPNDALAYAAVLGAIRAQASWVPLNARNVIEENIYILNNTATQWLFYHSSFADLVDRLRAEVSSLQGLVCLDAEGADCPSLGRWIEPFHGKAPDVGEDPDAVAALVSSGGTTGRPKGVMLTNRVWEAMIANFLAVMPIEAPPVHLMVAPMTHAAGVTSFPLLAFGATNIFMTETAPERIMQMIERHRVTHLFLPPTLIYLMLAHPKVRDYDYSSLRNFIYAAAPMSADKLKEAIAVFGPVMTQTYGQAEAPMICTFLSPADHREALRPGKAHRLLSCGRPTPFTRLAIMDEGGRLLAEGERGEIVVRGAMVMKGYFRNPAATAEVSTHGWHHTGDIGHIDQDGFVYIDDRKKDMIITGGFNVFPSEIEQVIWAHRAVQDCAVIGVPDEKWGEAVHAVVELKPDARVDAEELIALCKRKLGSVKAPKSVEFRDALPRSPVGKVLKRELRDPYWAGRDRAI